MHMSAGSHPRPRAAFRQTEGAHDYYPLFGLNSLLRTDSHLCLRTSHDSPCDSSLSDVVRQILYGTASPVLVDNTSGRDCARIRGPYHAFSYSPACPAQFTMHALRSRGSAVLLCDRNSNALVGRLACVDGLTSRLTLHGQPCSCSAGEIATTGLAVQCYRQRTGPVLLSATSDVGSLRGVTH